MTTSSSPPDDEVRGQSSTANAPTTDRKEAGLVDGRHGYRGLAAIGLGIWAVNVHSDLEEQTAATEAAEAQAAAQAEAAAAAAAEIEKINADNEVYVVSNEDVAQAESDVAAAEEAVAQANAAAAEASSAVSAAQDEASNCVPSSSKHERSATWHGQNANRQEQNESRRGSAHEDRSALSQPSETATPKAAPSSRPSRVLVPLPFPNRRRPYEPRPGSTLRRARTRQRNSLSTAPQVT